MSDTPAGIPEWAALQASPWLTHNTGIRMLEATAWYGIIEDRDLTSPPGSCGDGAAYLMAGIGGAWSTGTTGQLAIAQGANASNGWKFRTVAVKGSKLYVRDENIEILHNGSAWVNGASAGAPFRLLVAASDETTEITAGTAKITFEWPDAVTVSQVHIFVTTAAGSSGPIIVDVNDDGVSIFSTRPTIDTGERSSRDAAVASVLSTPGAQVIAAGSVMTIDIDDPGDGAKGLKVTFFGTYN